MKSGMKITRDSREKSPNYMKRAHEDDESSMCSYQTQVTLDCDEEDESFTIAETLRLEKKKCKVVQKNVGNASESLANNDLKPCQKLALVKADGDKESDEARSKTGEKLVLSLFAENNFSDPLLGSNAGVVDIVASLPKTRQTSFDELNHVYGSNADLINDGSKKQICFLQEEGGIAGEKASSDEKLCCESEKEDDAVDERLIQKKLRFREQARKAIHDDPSRCQNLASESTTGDETSIHITAGDTTQRQDSLLHDDTMEESVKSNELSENSEIRNDDGCNDSIEERLHKLRMMMASIEERTDKVERNMALFVQRKEAEARLM